MLEWINDTPNPNKADGYVAGLAGLEWLGDDGTLGAPTYDECFRNDPNFNACWQDMFRLAQGECAGGKHVGFGYPDYNACVEGRARANASQVCIPACEAYLRGSGDFPWGVYSEETCTVQDEINSILTNPNVARGQKAAGDTYAPITRDCKMGPATCGAADFLGMGTPTTCAGRPKTTPTKTGTGGGGTPPPPVGGGKRKSNAGWVGFIALTSVVGFALAAAGRAG